MIFICTVCILGLTCFSMVFSSRALGRQELNFKEVVIHTGDTLWAIAEEYAPHLDPRIFIHEVKQINHIDTASIYPGQIIFVPINP